MNVLTINYVPYKMIKGCFVKQPQGIPVIYCYTMYHFFLLNEYQKCKMWKMKKQLLCQMLF